MGDGEAYNLLTFGFRDPITLPELLRLKAMPRVMGVYIDPSFKRAEVVLPVLVINIASEETFTALSSQPAITPRQRNTTATYNVAPDDLDAKYGKTTEERTPVQYSAFKEYKHPPSLDDYQLVNDVACVLVHLHTDLPEPERCERFICGYNSDLHVYVLLGKGFHQRITIEDMSRLLAYAPMRTKCIGFFFGSKPQKASEAPGGLLVHISEEASTPSLETIASVPAPSPSPSPLPEPATPKRMPDIENQAPPPAKRLAVSRLLGLVLPFQI